MHVSTRIYSVIVLKSVLFVESRCGSRDYLGQWPLHGGGAGAGCKVGSLWQAEHYPDTMQNLIACKIFVLHSLNTTKKNFLPNGART